MIMLTAEAAGYSIQVFAGNLFEANKLMRKVLKSVLGPQGWLVWIRQYADEIGQHEVPVEGKTFYILDGHEVIIP